MQSRCFENTLNYPDDEAFFHRKISEAIASIWNSLLKNAELGSDCVYDGKAGELYWLTKMCVQFPHSLPRLQEKAQGICEELSQKICKKIRKRHYHRHDTSLLCGLAGEVLAVWHHLQTFHPQHEFLQECLDFYWSLCRLSIAAKSSTNEILYGRAGLLMGCTFLARNGRDNRSCRRQLIHCLLQDGKDACDGTNPSPPLVYAWHGKQYVGAAHGYAGILSALCANWSVVPAVFHDDVQKTMDWTLSLITSNANLPSSVTDCFRVRSGKDNLVHWCHGAPGVIPTLCQAYGVFGDRKYLDAARDLANTIWRFGLLRKGWGLCHGAPGNAYGFIALYNATQDDRYLRYAKQFALWLCCSPDSQSIVYTPDEPLGLYTGVCGAGQFLLDLMAGGRTSSLPFLVTEFTNGKVS
jgi:lantibiotic modifying enzyme